MYIAAVVKANRRLGEDSTRPDGDWACFLDEDKAKAIEKALAAKQRWESKTQSGGWGYGPYSILVGELTEQVRQPKQYELCPIKG